MVTKKALPKIDYHELLGHAAQDKRLEVLRSVQSAGSIAAAARANGVSYKAAWQALETLSNLAGAPLVEKAVGGSGGGGARLTAVGLGVLQAADLLHMARSQTLAQLGQMRVGSGLDLRSLSSVSFRTSMRNQLPCVVKRINKSAAAASVLLTLADGQNLVARITLESLQLLNLAPGRKVLAMFKATAVTVAPTIVGTADLNLLHGKVARRSAGAAGLEVSLQLATGLSLVGFAQVQSPLKLRQAAMAGVEQRAIVIGLVV